MSGGAAPERPFACRCGRLAGRLRDGGPEAHLLCHCRDCRAHHTQGGQVDPGAADLLETAPGRVLIERGAEHLAAIRLRPRGGMIRWVAACCGTALFSLPPLPRAGIVHVNAATLSGPPLPPVSGEAFVPRRGGGTAHKGALTLAGNVLSQVLAANLSGSWRDTPFFDADGVPVRTPHRLTADERAAAYSRLD